MTSRPIYSALTLSIAVGVGNLAGCGGGGDDPAIATAKSVPCNVSVEGVALQCGVLDVPENYDKPTGRRLSLPYVIVPALKAGAKREPVVFLTGGPGESAIGVLGSVVNAAPLYAERDLIVIEQRGNGPASPNLQCTETDLAACHRRLVDQGIDLAQYATSVAARDVVQLRKALGLAKWNLWGVSYGVSTAYAVLRQDAGAVNAAILDSGSEPSDIAYADLQSNLDGFTRLFAACQADPKCATAYPDLRTRFPLAVETLNVTPLDLAGTGLEDAVGTTSLDGATFALLMAQLQQSPAFARVPSIIDAVASGNLQLFGTAVGTAFGELSARAPASPTGFDPQLASSLGLNISVYCSEVPYTKVGVQPVKTLENWPDSVVKALTPSFIDACRSGVWPVPQVPMSDLQPVATSVRSLFLSGALDPVTPPLQAELGSVKFTNKTLITVPADTHALVGRNACATSIAAVFLDRQTTQSDLACLSAISPPAFTAP
jgi:pimeloyl-ACP methyl ester carboxylesterase